MFTGGGGKCHSPDERPVARQVFDIVFMSSQRNEARVKNSVAKKKIKK